MTDGPHGGPAGHAAVVLDIGAGVGAAVVTMPEGMVGAEVDIVSTDDVGRPRRHVAVVRRPTPNGMVASLVFDAVEPGRYALAVRPDGPPVLPLEIRDSTVTTAVWPGLREVSGRG